MARNEQLGFFQVAQATDKAIRGKCVIFHSCICAPTNCSPIVARSPDRTYLSEETQRAACPAKAR